MSNAPYGSWAKIYRDLGLEPRPVKNKGFDSKGKPYGKGCHEPNWQLPDTELPEGTIEKWDAEYADFNIGLRMGTRLPDGTFLGALDIDHDAYVPLGRALLKDPPSGRIGKKGAVFFVRYLPFDGKEKFRVTADIEGRYGQVAEWLLDRRLCIIPPSIHPDTRRAYEWIGTPLHEMDFSKLPLIGE